jgi:hypothetical protein
MKGVTKAFILTILGLVVLIPFASTFPDGLEKVVESLGLREPESTWSGLMPDYTFPFAENLYMTKLISGLIGLFLAFGIARVVGWAIARKNRA